LAFGNTAKDNNPALSKLAVDTHEVSPFHGEVG